MNTETCATTWARIYIAGPIEVAKQIIRAECMREGLCVTIEPTLYIYTGGEEAGYVVGLNDYPRFPLGYAALMDCARDLALKLLEGTHQHSVMVQTPAVTEWFTKREASPTPERSEREKESVIKK